MPKKAKNKTGRNYPELYCKILKECAEQPMCTKSHLAQKFDLSEIDITFKFMNELRFIDVNSGIVELLPQGFSTYLSIGSQKHSNEQARKATIFAIWAIGISIVSFVASIFFNLLSIL